LSDLIKIEKVAQGNSIKVRDQRTGNSGKLSIKLWRLQTFIGKVNKQRKSSVLQRSSLLPCIKQVVLLRNASSSEILYPFSSFVDLEYKFNTKLAEMYYAYEYAVSYGM
jgi:hypothetical protein